MSVCIQSLVLLALSVQIILVPLFPILAKKFGRRKALTSHHLNACLDTSFLTKMVCVMTVALVNFSTTPYQLVFLSVLMTITDSVEYGQWKMCVMRQ